ncbi:MAG: D-alanyl-D-alanine carboxypeptidase family protein [Candidatus Omnitrophota bacterium]
MYRIIAFALLASFFTTQIYASSAKKTKPTLTARSAIAVDLRNNKVLYSRNPHMKLPPASTTKLVTALVVIDRLKLNDIVKISRNAAGAVPSKAHLKLGASYNVKDLLSALLISSANDAAVALAEAVSGSEEKFAKLMTKKARSLGAKDSNFLTASGLPKKGQYSTASDMAIIANAALNKKLIKQILAQKSTSITGSDGRKIYLKNHNKLLWKSTNPKILGKTGYTMNAKHCFVGVVHYKNRKVAIAVLKSSKPWSDVDAILSN